MEVTTVCLIFPSYFDTDTRVLATDIRLRENIWVKLHFAVHLLTDKRCTVSTLSGEEIVERHDWHVRWRHALTSPSTSLMRYTPEVISISNMLERLIPLSPPCLTM